jgi:DNA mismatch endonuclease (patch repair protein)
MPETNREKWAGKIARNRDRDEANRRLLVEKGWRVLDVWECAVRGPGRLEEREMIERVCDWIESDSKESEIRSVQVSD